MKPTPNDGLVFKGAALDSCSLPLSITPLTCGERFYIRSPGLKPGGSDCHDDREHTSTRLCNRAVCLVPRIAAGCLAPQTRANHVTQWTSDKSWTSPRQGTETSGGFSWKLRRDICFPGLIIFFFPPQPRQLVTPPLFAPGHRSDLPGR